MAFHEHPSRAHGSLSSRGLVGVAGALVLAVVFVSCSPSGRVELPEQPERVILFGPNLSATAVRLGHAARVVAVTDYCRWPARLGARPRVGGALDPDLERIAALRPDLLVLQGQSAALRSFAAAQGIAVADVKMDDDVAAILRGIVTIDSLLAGSPPTRGRALVDTLRRQLDALGSDDGHRPREVMLVVSRDPDAVRNVLTAGRGTFLDELLARIGARNWGRTRGRGYFDVSLESVAASPPQVVVEIVTDPRRSDPETARMAWRRVIGPGPAVVEYVDPAALVPGPGIVETARGLAAVIGVLGAGR